MTILYSFPIEDPLRDEDDRHWSPWPSANCEHCGLPYATQTSRGVLCVSCRMEAVRDDEADDHRRDNE